MCTMVVLTNFLYVIKSFNEKKIISTETETSDLFLDTFLVKALKTIFGNNFEH